MAIRPKQFYAARTFRVGRHSFRPGDPIPHGMLLQRLLRFGDKFAVASKTAPPKPAAETPQPSPSSGDVIPSTKEDDK